MESIEHSVGDFAADDRRVFEKVLGHKLQENQRVIIQVMDIDSSKTNDNSSESPVRDQLGRLGYLSRFERRRSRRVGVRYS